LNGVIIEVANIPFYLEVVAEVLVDLKTLFEFEKVQRLSFGQVK